MLRAITCRNERSRSFDSLCERLRDNDECDVHERIVQRAGPNEQSVYWHRQARVWSVLRPPEGRRNYWWCAYGLSLDYPQDQVGLKISVEINPTAAEVFTRSCAGMFASSPTGDTTFLCHKGLINGATMDFFKLHYRGDWTDVCIPGDSPEYMEVAIIGSIDGPQLPYSIAEFSREADRIRNLANGAPLVGQGHTFAPEFEGRRRRYSLDSIIAPQANHGRVVNTLENKLRSKGYVPRNDMKRDLFIEDDCKRMLLLFEVKTTVSTTSVYQGVGQLMLNGQAQGHEWDMVLVLPQALDVNTGRALDELGIKVLTYTWRGRQPAFGGLDKILEDWH